ncbi:MAG TPA: hypothetical protein VKZ49_12935 [Polyangiaceae bacterium]|nr:hypothetical protein [Polyangiaceae bacterium]
MSVRGQAMPTIPARAAPASPAGRSDPARPAATSGPAPAGSEASLAEQERLLARVRELEQRLLTERNRVLEEQDDFVRMLIEEHEAARVALVRERDAALAELDVLHRKEAARSAAAAGTPEALEILVQRLTDEREASLDTLRRLQQQRDAAHAELDAMRQERDLAKEELAAWMSRLGVSSATADVSDSPTEPPPAPNPNHRIDPARRVHRRTESTWPPRAHRASQTGARSDGALPLPAGASLRHSPPPAELAAAITAPPVPAAPPEAEPVRAGSSYSLRPRGSERCTIPLKARRS